MEKSVKRRRFRKWEVKNADQKKEYRTSLGTTDYDIPMFGYRSALLIFLATFGSILVIPWICFGLGVDYRPFTVLFGGLASGFSVSYSQFFIERDKGLCKTFWLVGSLLSLCAGVIIMIVVYTGWLL